VLAACALERVERLGDVFPGVLAPAALLAARREPDAAARARQPTRVGSGWRSRAQLTDGPDGAWRPLLSPAAGELVARLDAEGERLGGRVTFLLGVVTGDNARALAPGGPGAPGAPILVGRDVGPHVLRPPSTRLLTPLERVQQAAPRAAYARPKLVYRFIAKEPIAAVDRAGTLLLNSANGLAPDDPELELDYLAGVLNSAPVRFAHRARQTLPRVLRSHLERLPLPRAPRAARRRIAALSRGLAAADPAARARLVAELDERVAAAFSLSPAEWALVRSSCPTS
jgi:hypothetical protein